MLACRRTANIVLRLARNYISSCRKQGNMSVDDLKGVNVIQEGKAEVYTPKSVFYNPVQEFNRDLTVAVITQFAKEHFLKLREKEKKLWEKNEQTDKKSDCENNQFDRAGQKESGLDDSDTETKECRDGTLEGGKSHEDGIRIFEGLAASGLRSVRFGLEIPGVKEVIANDFDKNAVSFIEKNITKNKLEGLVGSSHGDAAMVMYQNKGVKDRFDVIDLDPYGSPSPFLDSAVQAVKDGGLLCVTCTDLAVMCGNAGETCHSKYGAMSLKAKFCHEMALRIILQSLESHANRYSRYIIPVISMSADFYVRVFVRVFSGQAKVKESVSKLAMVYHCTGCGSFALQPLGVKVPTKGDNFKYSPSSGPPVGHLCSHCGFKQHFGGPIWADAIHDQSFIEKVLQNVQKESEKLGTSDRIVGMLSVMAEEIQDVPLYYIVDELCNVLHCTAPNMVQIRSAILNAGYRVSLSHAAKNSYKTDAPGDVVWDVMRTWVKDHPVKAGRLKDGTPAKAILMKEPATNISFDIHPEANPRSRQKGLLRWQVNPQRDWGPKARAKKSQPTETLDEKRERNRGKRKKTQKPADLKSFLCKRFKEGHCNRGDQCCYGHDIEGGKIEDKQQTGHQNYL